MIDTKIRRIRLLYSYTGLYIKEVYSFSCLNNYGLSISRKAGLLEEVDGVQTLNERNLFLILEQRYVFDEAECARIIALYNQHRWFVFL